MGNLDYLAARLHGRRSAMAEGEKLDTLTRIRTLPEFARSLYPELEFHDIMGLQRHLVEDLAREMSRFSEHLGKFQARLINWMIVRFDVENLKVLLRASIRKITPEETIAHVIATPGQKVQLILPLTTAGSVLDFMKLVPGGPVKASLEKAIREYGEDARPFFLEAGLDRGYYTELMKRLALVPEGDRQEIETLIRDEADIFHVMLVLRGRFNYGLPADELISMHVPGTGIGKSTFHQMLNDPDPVTAARRVVMRVFDPLPYESGSGETTIPVATFENLAWRRYLRLANTTFRRSHMGFGVVVAYVALRRAEIANLIKISEGIRMGMEADTIKTRLIPRMDIEGSYV